MPEQRPNDLGGHHERKVRDGLELSDNTAFVVAKSLPYIVSQFRAAVAECRRVEREGGDLAGPLGTFLERLYGLMEALTAILQIDEVRALRFARARYQHQQASLTYRDADGTSTWRPLSQLPRPRDDHHWNDDDARHYDRLLTGQPVTDALDAAERAVNEAT